jgi:predicted dehydrogenase
VPAGLHWDEWLGPAPVRDYHGGLHPGSWRSWWDFGNGTLGDMACHLMDLPFWALGIRHPTSIEAEGPPVHPETAPIGLAVRYEFPSSAEGQPPIKLTWYDGNRTPKSLSGQSVPGMGVFFVGEAGQMFADYGSYRLYPQEKFRGYKPPQRTIPRSIGHHAEWIKACKEGTPTTCNFQYSGALTEAVLLGTVAYRSGKRLEWNHKQLTITNSPEAQRLIRREYRHGWTL